MVINYGFHCRNYAFKQIQVVVGGRSPGRVLLGAGQGIVLQVQAGLTGIGFPEAWP